MTKSDSGEEPDFDIGYDGHSRRQARLGLEMTPAQRLQWLEAKLGEMRYLLGKARPNLVVASAPCERERAEGFDDI